jgi:alanine racemase
MTRLRDLSLVPGTLIAGPHNAITDVPGVRVGDECVVLGSQKGTAGEASITAEELSQRLGTIPWEVLTCISRRVPRFYREP